MKEEYKKFLEAVSSFIKFLKDKEDKLYFLESEITNKSVVLSRVNQDLANVQKNLDIRKQTADHEVLSIKDRANNLMKEAERKMAEADSMKVLAARDMAKAEELKIDLRAKITTLGDKESQLDEALEKTHINGSGSGTGAGGGKGDKERIKNRIEAAVK